MLVSLRQAGLRRKDLQQELEGLKTKMRDNITISPVDDTKKIMPTWMLLRRPACHTYCANQGQTIQRMKKNHFMQQYYLL